MYIHEDHSWNYEDDRKVAKIKYDVSTDDFVIEETIVIRPKTKFGQQKLFVIESLIGDKIKHNYEELEKIFIAIKEI